MGGPIAGSHQGIPGGPSFDVLDARRRRRPELPIGPLVHEPNTKTDRAGIRSLPRMPLHQPLKGLCDGFPGVARLARRILNLALDSVNASAAGEVPGAHVADPDGQFLSDRFDTCAGDGPTGERR